MKVFIPGFDNNKYLLPLYEKVHAAIRQYDNNTIVFFEPSLTDILGGGFNNTPEGSSYLNR